MGRELQNRTIMKIKYMILISVIQKSISQDFYNNQIDFKFSEHVSLNFTAIDINGKAIYFGFAYHRFIMPKIVLNVL